MKKISLFLICSICLFVTSVKAEQFPSRGLYVSLIQDPPVLCNPNEILKLIDFAKKNHIDKIFIQVYRANEAWFPSRVASTQLYQSCLKHFSEDPLNLLIREAHLHKIQVHAWLNLLSLGANKDARMLKKYGEGILTRNYKTKESIEQYKIDGQYFLEPSDRRVRRELSDITRELLDSYPYLDGIQFDYIRYPDVNPAYGYNPNNVLNFKKKTKVRMISEKDPLWRQWKREQVTQLLKGLAHKARKMRPRIKVSATGCLPFVRAYEEAFQDWPSWINQGIVDFVTIMNYPKDIKEFEKNIQEAKKRTQDFKKINVAVGAYKFIDHSDGFAAQFQSCEKSIEGTCVIFHYNNLLENPTLSKVLIDSSPKKQ